MSTIVFLFITVIYSYLAKFISHADGAVNLGFVFGMQFNVTSLPNGS